MQRQAEKLRLRETRVKMFPADWLSITTDGEVVML